MCCSNIIPFTKVLSMHHRLNVFQCKMTVSIQHNILALNFIYFDYYCYLFFFLCVCISSIYYQFYPFILNHYITFCLKLVSWIVRLHFIFKFLFFHKGSNPFIFFILSKAHYFYIIINHQWFIRK